jgi:photoactive yellow protein
MTLDFDDGNALASLNGLSDAALDGLAFGVIAFDPAMVVQRYNRHETESTGLKPERVIGHQFFTEIAQCMNNFLVAQKYLDAQSHATPLDETIDFVLTWRMRPTPVKLRLLYSPEIALHYLLLKRLA